MTLQTDLITIPLAQGIDTGTDSKAVAMDKLLVLENTVVDKTYAIEKRSGRDEISPVDASSNPLPSALRLHSYKEEILQTSEDASLYSYSSSTQNWVKKGEVSNLSFTGNQILNEGGLTAFYASSSELDIHGSGQEVLVLDKNTKNILKRETISSALRLVVASFQDKVFVIYSNSSGDVLLREYNPASFSFNAPVTLASGAAYQFNAFAALWSESSEDFLYVGFPTTTSDPRVLIVDASLSVVATVNQAEPGAIQNNALTLVYDEANSRTFCCYGSLDSGDVYFKAFSFNDAGTIQNALTTLFTTTDLGTDLKITGAPLGGAIEFFYSYRDLISDLEYHFHTQTMTVATSALTGGGEKLLSGRVASAAFTLGGKSYVSALLYDGAAFSNSLFLVDLSGNPGAIFQRRGVSGYNLETPLHSVVRGADNATLSHLVASSVQNAFGLFFVTPGLYQTSFSLSGASSLISQEVLDSLVIAGGYISQYDGESVYEMGLFSRPRIMGTSSASAGLVPNGTYFYVAVYEFVDAKGQIHFSEVSPQVTVTVSGGPKQVEVTVSTLKLTRKPDLSVKVKIYRTEDASTGPFYEVSTNAVNDRTIPSVLIIDNTPNTGSTGLILNTPLYTEGGVLENGVPAASMNLLLHRGRLFSLPMDDPNRVDYSKKSFSKLFPSFPEEFYFRVDANRDTVSSGAISLGTLDEKVIILKKTSLLVTFGEGPSDTGEGTFADPELISTDTGCINRNSLVNIPQGLIFLSQRGYYLLSRNLQIEYIGDPIEAFNNLVPSSALIEPSLNEARITTTTGEMLVFDYFRSQWKTNTNSSSIDSKLWKGRHALLKSDGTLFVDNPSLFEDGVGTVIAQRIRTSWLKFNTLQGYQRVRRATFLGTYKSVHTLLVKVYYDYEASHSNTYLISPTSTPPYQFEIHLARQKCQAVSFEILEVPDIGTPGGSMELSEMVIEVGIKKGVNKKDPARRFGLQ